MRAEKLSEASHQIHDPHTERIGKDLERLKGHVALPALDLAHVRPVQPRPVGEHVLRPAARLPERPHLRPNLFLDSLHQQQFGASLFLTILVITSKREMSEHVE